MKFIKNKYHILAVNSFLIALVSYGLKNITNMFLARNLMVGLYGDFTLGIKTFAVVSTLLLLGSGNATKRFLPNYLYNEDNRNINNYVLWNIRLLLLSNISFLVFLLIFIVLVLGLHLFNIKALMDHHFVVYILLLVPLGSFALLLPQYLLSNKNVYWYNFLKNVAKYILYIIILIPAVYFIGIIFNEVTLLFLVFIVFFVLAIFEYLLTFQKLSGVISISSVRSLVNLPKVRQFKTGINLLFCSK